MTQSLVKTCLLALVTFGFSSSAWSQEMDELWGESVVKLRADDAERGQLFDQGNYAMFVHWGLYSDIANKYKDKTNYGIGE